MLGAVRATRCYIARCSERWAAARGVTYIPWAAVATNQFVQWHRRATSPNALHSTLSWKEWNNLDIVEYVWKEWSELIYSGLCSGDVAHDTAYMANRRTLDCPLLPAKLRRTCNSVSLRLLLNTQVKTATNYVQLDNIMHKHL